MTSLFSSCWSIIDVLDTIRAIFHSESFLAATVRSILLAHLGHRTGPNSCILNYGYIYFVSKSTLPLACLLMLPSASSVIAAGVLPCTSSEDGTRGPVEVDSTRVASVTAGPRPATSILSDSTMARATITSQPISIIPSAQDPPAIIPITTGLINSTEARVPTAPLSTATIHSAPLSIQAIPSELPDSSVARVTIASLPISTVPSAQDPPSILAVPSALESDETMIQTGIVSESNFIVEPFSRMRIDLAVHILGRNVFNDTSDSYDQ